MMYNVSTMRDRLITVRKAAAILGVNPETLRRWDRKGKFKAKRHPINGYRIYDLAKIRELESMIFKGSA